MRFAGLLHGAPCPSASSTLPLAMAMGMASEEDACPRLPHTPPPLEHNAITPPHLCSPFSSSILRSRCHLDCCGHPPSPEVARWLWIQTRVVTPLRSLPAVWAIYCIFGTVGWK